MNRRLLFTFAGCAAALAAVLVAAALPSGCNTDEGSAGQTCKPFEPAPECKPELTITPLAGSRQMVLASLQIAAFNEGFDLNCDGKVDNVLNPLGAVANSTIAESFMTKHDIVVPIEMFGYDGKDTECAKFAFYLGRVNEDRDGDGKETSWEAKSADCDDTNPAVHPGAMEDTSNRIDDDCDGYADNTMANSPPADDKDMDGDGVSPAKGDCDDRADTPEHKAAAAMRHRGAKDVCGNGIDEDCDGVADNDVTCDPFSDNKAPIHAQALSFSGTDLMNPASLKPLITFPDGNVKSGVLRAGPDLFELSLAIDSDINLKLTLSGARVRMKLAEKSNGTYVTEGILGGVLQAVSLAQIHISAGNILKKEQSLLDGIFVGPAGVILGLASDADGHYLPDVDVDGDGLESFWQENKPLANDGGMKPPDVIDTCKDGNGELVHNNWDGKGTPCTLATDSKGRFRFVDGLSAALKFTAVPVKIVDVTAK